MNKPATDTAPAPAMAATEAAERSLIDEVIRQTPQIPSPQFAIPRDWAEVEALAKRICAAGWAPKSHCDQSGRPNQASIELAVLQGMELGVAPLLAVQGIAIVNGVPAIWGDLMLAVVTASGWLEWKQERVEGEGDEVRAVCTVKRRNRPDPVTRVFTWGMARKAGLAGKKGPWQAYPSRMLAMRARSWALRDEFTDVLRGMASMEELRDAGALDRAIAATERQGGAAEDITAALKGEPESTSKDVPATAPSNGAAKQEAAAHDGAHNPAPEKGIGAASDEGAKINTPALTSKHDGKHPAETPDTSTGSTASGHPPHDPETGEIHVDPAAEDTERTAVVHHNPDGTAEPGTTADLLGPTEADWMDAAQAMIARIDDAANLADLEVIAASGHVKPELDRMSTAAPQQHRAVTGFIAEKRKELSA